MPTFDEDLARRARRQHGLITVDQAEALGGNRRMLQARARRGTLTQTEVNVFRFTSWPPTWHSRLHGLVLGAGPGALASHRSAAALWGLDGFGQGTPELTIPRNRRFRRRGARIHESSDLALAGMRTREGIPVTDPSRTLLDLARFLGDDRLLLAIESARRLELTSWPELIAVLAKHARQGRPGIRRLRRVIAANVHRDEVTDSGFELLFLALLREHGLPEPVLHHRLLSSDGTLLAEIDLALPELRIAIELDGSVHRTRDVFERDRPRQNRIALEGWTILRFTWATFVADPQRIVAEVRAAIALRRRAA